MREARSADRRYESCCSPELGLSWLPSWLSIWCILQDDASSRDAQPGAEKIGEQIVVEYSYGVSDHHIEIYRQKAETCRHQADMCSHSEDRESWLRLADDWTKMAREVERHDTRRRSEHGSSWSARRASGRWPSRPSYRSGPVQEVRRPLRVPGIC